MRFVNKTLFILFLAVSIVWGAACFKAILRQSLSFFAKLSLDGQFSTKEIFLRHGKLVFLDVSFCQMDGSKILYEIQAPELVFSFSWNSSLWQIDALAEIKAPQIVVQAPCSQAVFAEFLKRQEAPKSRSGWIDWQWEATNTSLSWPEIDLQASLSAKKAGPNDLFYLELLSGSSRLELSSLKEESKQKATLHFSNWDLKLLQPILNWIGLAESFEQGRFDGKIECKELFGPSMHLSIRGDLVETSLSSSYGRLFVAKAALETELDALIQESAFSLSWGRLHYSGGQWQKGHCKMELLEGALSYCFDLGLQWQSTGRACLGEKSYPIALSAKGFWPTSETAWLDLSLSSSEGTCLVHSNFHTWRVQADEVSPFWGEFIQEFLEKKSFFHEWNWERGMVSCLFEWEPQLKVTFHTFLAEEAQLRHKVDALKSLSCDAIQMHFGAPETPGSFSLEGLSGSWDLGGAYRMIATDWSASGSLDAEQIGDSQWSGQIAICKESSKEMLSFKTHFEAAKRELQHWILQGSAAEYPFEMQVFSEDAFWSVFFEGGSYVLPFGANLEEVQGHLLLGLDHWKLEDAHADFVFRENGFRLEAFRLEKEREDLFLDLRLIHGFWDVARVVASSKDGQLTIDPEKTEVLGSLLDPKSVSCQLGETFSCHLDIPWASFFLGKKLGFSVPSLSNVDIPKSIALDFLYEKGKVCKWTLKTDRTPWEESDELYVLQVEKWLNQWKCSLQKGKAASISFLAGYEGRMWTIQEGDVQFANKSSLSCQFQGQCSTKGDARFSLSRCIYRGNLEEIKPWIPQVEENSVDVSLQANGCAAIDLASLDYEVDFDLTEVSLKTENFELRNHKTMHALFSRSKGVMLQGIDCQLRMNGDLLADCAAKLFHYRPLPGAWAFHEARIHLPERSFSILSSQWQPFDPHQDVALTADFRGSSDFSVFSCSIKEGLIPFGGELRHVQNLEFYLDENEIAADFFYVHQSRDLHCKIAADRGDLMRGSVTLEDPDFLLREYEQPLQINWQYQPPLGVMIESIQGSFPGIDAAFYLQAADDQSHLIGSARLDFRQLAPFVSPLIAEFFTELDMGRGYALKGKLQIDRKDLSQIFFSGQFIGKQLELCGYVFRTLLANVDVKPEEVKISNLKVSDSSGFFRMDEMIMQGKKDQPWTFSIPLLSFSEFRPSLLKEVGGDEGSISPLVIRKMHFRNIQGVLEDKSTYTAEGELYFINSYKRQHTLFDVPSDVLGRIIGLDMELLIPVRGALRYDLKEGLFEISALEEAYSEGDRSQFFLASSNAPATLDLDGNLHIQVKMKQYVLFKLTEAFTIFIYGKLKHPQYHLQKKK